MAERKKLDEEIYDLKGRRKFHALLIAWGKHEKVNCDCTGKV